MKTKHENKRTKRKEIQFSEAEYIAIENKANAARLSVAAFIREAALGKELSAALTIEESEPMKSTANISYKMQVNLNQIARLANIHGLPFIMDAIREYISRTNEYFKTGTWREMDLSAYESEQKQREQLAAKVRELQEKNTELQKAATNYYLYTAEGERLFCERHNCRIYPDNRGIGILKLPIIRLIRFPLKSVGHISIMRFRYGMCMCIGVRITNNIGEKYRPIKMKYLRNRPIQNNYIILHLLMGFTMRQTMLT